MIPFSSASASCSWAVLYFIFFVQNAAASLLTRSKQDDLHGADVIFFTLASVFVQN